MVRRAWLAATLLGLLGLGACTDWRASRAPRPRGTHAATPPAALAGSESCRRCHEEFYRKWATSFHGLAMRPWGAALARSLAPQARAIVVAGRRYQARLSDEAAFVEESGRQGVARLPIAHVLGGKDVCYFLTPRERGFLQVLPVAYDVRRREWFATPASAVRHAAHAGDAELPWTDRAYTFNTSCFNCHVSQLHTNYDAATDAYRSTWAEPGINCETCHGPAAAHAALFASLPAGALPDDPRIVSTRRLTTAQRNDLCASCHAKASPLWSEFRPGEPFYDHFDLVTLENGDYHADGRDLGENYTLTSWTMSPCVRSGKLDCLHCHTSSGRFRFAERPNAACLPCHAERVENAAAHTRHADGRPGSRCVECHMPTTEFARMRRSDHSMRPPVPEASLAFGSKDACTLCHAKRDSRWAERSLRAWRPGGSRWTARMLREGRLVAAARAADWSRLPEMLSYLSDPERDTIVTASLVRLLAACPDPARRGPLLALCQDPSPLVRAAAVTALARDGEAQEALVAATRDERRLVRIRAADALTGHDLSALDAAARASVERAGEELRRSLAARPDQYTSHYDLGTLALDAGDPARAVEHYRRALALRPEHVPSLVNLALASARLGRPSDAEESLRRALAIDGRSVPALVDLGLLLAEAGRRSEAEAALRRALEVEPRHAQAAFNLASLVAERDPREAARWARLAAREAPGEPRYAEAAAFYERRARR